MMASLLTVFLVLSPLLEVRVDAHPLRDPKASETKQEVVSVSVSATTVATTAATKLLSAALKERAEAR